MILQPHITIAYSQSGMMAPDGRCKFGDANGDGYVRSEGVGVVLLKPPRRRARRRRSASGRDPRQRGQQRRRVGRHLGQPSRDGQAALLRAAYRAAGVDPQQVGYVEAHGTGTRAGDPVELGALGDVLAPGRAAGQRAACVGSVKTNIGHTEGAAGVAGLLKCVLALQHGEVPASLHLDQPNPRHPLGRAALRRADLAPSPGPAPRLAALRRRDRRSASAAPTPTSCSRRRPEPAPPAPRRRPSPAAPRALGGNADRARARWRRSYVDLLATAGRERGT